MSSIVNKIKEAVHSDKHTSEPEGTHGPHSTRTANAADPRVDSDRDHSHTIGGTTGGNAYSENTHHSTGTSGLMGSSGHTAGHTAGHTTGHSTAGPHNSDALNKIDPRVDSDRDGSRTVGGNNTYGTTGTTGTAGFGSSTHSEGTHGPHGSRVANAADPRVDSDRDGSRTAGGNTYGTTGTAGFGSSTHGEGAHGPHGSRVANAADPRVDSDRDGSRTVGGNNYGNTTGHSTLGHVGAAVGGTHGTGPAPNTAGPHKSDALNKADPRVDSNLDGSRTIGQDKTYHQS